MRDPKSIRALFALPGFLVVSELKGLFGDRYARGDPVAAAKKRPSAPPAASVAEVATISFEALGEKKCSRIELAAFVGFTA